MKGIIDLQQVELDFIISSLNEKYSDYLLQDGKWMTGGFEILFRRNVDRKSTRYDDYLKLEVFMMLPKEIKEEIVKVMQFD